MSDEKEIRAPAANGPVKRRRRRKKEFTAATYGARLPHEDARIADEYALRNGLERADVVRLAMRHFAYKQGLRYPAKSEIEETRARIFRDHFAAVSDQLDGLLAAVRALPETLFELCGGKLSSVGTAGGNGLLVSEESSGPEFAGRVEAELRSQRRIIEQARFSSVLALRLITNYLVEPQIRSLSAADTEALKPHLRAAREGKVSWGVVLSAVMKLTGDCAMAELGLKPPDDNPGTVSAARVGGADGGNVLRSELAEDDLEEIL